MDALSPGGAEALSRVSGPPRNPQLLYELWRGGGLCDRDLPTLIDAVWVRNDDDSPESGLGQAEWLELYRASGYFVFPTNLKPPEDVSTIYRGATPERKRRMSWTCNLETAEQFAQRGKLLGRPARVYKATVAPANILAYFGRREFEVVVDPRTLDISEL